MKKILIIMEDPQGPEDLEEQIRARLNEIGYKIVKIITEYKEPGE